MSQFDTTELLANIKGLAFVPTAQATFTDDDLLRLADNEIKTSILSQIMSVRGEYYVTYSEYSISNQATQGYDIPTRAIGTKLSDVTVRRSDGIELSVPWIEASEVPYNNTTFQQYNQVYCFLRGNKIHLYPLQSSVSGFLRLYYFARPSKLVSTTKVAQIASIDTISNTVALSNLPPNFTPGIVCDFVRGTPHFSTLQMDAPIAAAGVGTLTFASLPDGLAVGDYVTLAGETPVPQIPFEFYPVLAQRVAVKILEAQDDSKALATAQTKLLEIEKNMLALITPRIEGEPKKIVGIFTPLNSPRRPNRFGNY